MLSVVQVKSIHFTNNTKYVDSQINNTRYKLTET